VIEFAEHVRRHWFVVARSNAIKSDPSRVFLLGRPIVLVRRNTGVVIALEDRCPHRGALLSDGRIGPMGLSCKYHGWTFDQLGHCTAMPGMIDATPVGDVRVPAFLVIERDGFIWISLHTDRPLPDRVMAMQSENLRFTWQAKWAAPAIEAQENFLDALHTHTIHPWLVRRESARGTINAELNLEGDGFRVDYEGQPTQSGLLFRLFESRRTRERAYFSSLSTAQLEYRYAKGGAVWFTVCFTPETLVSTHLFATLHVEGRWAPRWIIKALVWPFLRAIAQQDRLIVESLQRARAHFENRKPVITSLDIVRPYLEEAWSGSSSTLPRKTHVSMQL
jgi:phenylpropionate dioxygenase-like ring-hydroxylating dioxygenase large terminal subunit